MTSEVNHAPEYKPEPLNTAARYHSYVCGCGRQARYAAEDAARLYVETGDEEHRLEAIRQFAVAAELLAISSTYRERGREAK